MIAYNHEKFIRQAIESVMAQDVDFAFELIIGEDSSNDATREVIRDTCKQAKISICLMYSSQNVGMHANFARTFAACRGEFIATLEGDDYWVSTEKLQMQVSLLRSRPSAPACFHSVSIRSESDLDRRATFDGFDSLPSPFKPEIGYDDVCSYANRGYCQTSSLVFRARLVESLPGWLKKYPWVDWFLLLRLTEQGCLIGIPEIMSVYRLHPGGITLNSHWADRDTFARMLRDVSEASSRKIRGAAIRWAAAHENITVYELERAGNIDGARTRLTNLIKSNSGGFRMLLKRIGWWLRLSFPRTWRIARILLGARGLRV